MSDQRRKALKPVLQLLCQLLWMLGLMVGLSGVYLLMKYNKSSLFFSQAHITLPAVLTLTSAAFLLATGCLGSWLSLRDSSCLQGLVVLFLTVAKLMKEQPLVGYQILEKPKHTATDGRALHCT